MCYNKIVFALHLHTDLAIQYIFITRAFSGSHHQRNPTECNMVELSWYRHAVHAGGLLLGSRHAIHAQTVCSHSTFDHVLHSREAASLFHCSNDHRYCVSVSGDLSGVGSSCAFICPIAAFIHTTSRVCGIPEIDAVMARASRRVGQCVRG